MRILFLTHRLPYAPNRGDRIRAYYLLREMSRFADVSLFSLVHDDDEAGRAGAVPFASSVTVARVARLGNLIRGGLSLLSDRPLTHALLDAPSARAALAALIRREPPDLVVAFCSGMARFAVEPPLAGLPLVLDMVDVDSAKWAERAAEARSPQRWIFRREARTLGAFEAAAARQARITLVVNERERDAMRALAPEARVVVSPNGVDLDAFRPPDDAPARDGGVIFCGVMSYYPNEEGVLWFAREVWPKVRAARPDATFQVVGSGVTQAVRNLGARDRSIQVVGAVDAVPPYLSKAAVSVAPLRFARGVQNKVLEAIAAGLDVVTTPAVQAGLPQEVLAHCRVADEPGAFAAAVIAALDARRSRGATRDEPRLLRALGWSERLQPLEALLTEAAGSRSHPPVEVAS